MSKSLRLMMMLVALLIASAGCQTFQSGGFDEIIESLQPEIRTNAPASPATSTTVESAPVAAPSSDDAFAAGAFARPAIAFGPDGTAFVAAEGSGMQSIYLYVKPPAGKWSGGQVAKTQRGGTINTSRIYVPDLVVDGDGWAFVSMRCGPKEWGVLHGPAIYVRAPDGTGQWRFIGLTTGAAHLDIDAGDPGNVYLMARDGAWGIVTRQATLSRQGTFKAAGFTGEKFDLDVTGDRWVTAMNGCSVMASSFGYGFENVGNRVTWASHAAYPGQGNDLCYPSVCADTTAPGRAYIASVFGGMLCVQVVIGGKPQYPIDKLALIGKATLEDRCSPRLVASARGVVAVWKQGPDIVAVNLKKALKGKATPTRICSGSFPAAAVDPAGKLVVAYVSGSSLRITSVNMP